VSPNVVALPGYSVPSDEPVETVVDILERALFQAKQGRIVGVALVTVERQPLANVFEWHAEQMSRHTLIAGVTGLHWRMGQIAAEEDKEDNR
jgi:hypothetical protein